MKSGFCAKVIIGSLLCGYAFLTFATDAFAWGGDHGAGQSLFDKLFLTPSQNRYQIPYPVTQLITELETYQGYSINGQINHLPVILIPIGRCINRYSASPDFFKFPSMVMAATKEPAVLGSEQYPFIKDRLYITYQPKNHSMEVISYNSIAGRFEFQSVRDYDGEGVPEVTYAERSTCLTCHQNQGPIFSRAPWDETDFNRDIYQAVVKAGELAGDIPPQARNTDVVDIDNSTGRSNKYPLYQTFWHQICRAETEIKAIQCRASQFETMIRNRLQQNNHLTSQPEKRNDFTIPDIIERASLVWPEGISIASSDIPNANPLYDGITEHLASADDLKRSRLHTIKWFADDIYGMIEGLADLIPLSDMKELDNRLYQLAKHPQHGMLQLEGLCQMERVGLKEKFVWTSAPSLIIKLLCKVQDGLISREYQLLGNLEVISGAVSSSSSFYDVAIYNDSSYINFGYDGGVVKSNETEWQIDLLPYDVKHRFHIRLPGLGIIDRIVMKWQKMEYPLEDWPVGHIVEANSRIDVISDFAILDEGIERMIILTELEVTDTLTSKPFRGRETVRTLLNQLF